MFRGRSKGSRRGRGGQGAVHKVPLRKGLFSDGIWRCNCEPERLPATHFQTKNGGKNHGRWFYTCQQSQPKRCDFFLWDDEAKGREAAAVLNNSRTEPLPGPVPVTPTKPSTATGLVTPETESRFRFGSPDAQTPYTPSKSTMRAPSSSIRGGQTGHDTQGTATTNASSDEEFYDWPASEEEELGKAADQVSSNQSSRQTNMPPPVSTPRKAPQIDLFSTPGKRRYDEMAADTEPSFPTHVSAQTADDVFTTPSTSARSGVGLFATNNTNAPAQTPTPIRYQNLPLTQASELATEILTVLDSALPTLLPTDTRTAVAAICNKHVMYTRGITKGRDVSRAMVKKKEEQIVALQGEIEGLKNERETNRAVIRHLRRDMAGRKG